MTPALESLAHQLVDVPPDEVHHQDEHHDEKREDHRSQVGLQIRVCEWFSSAASFGCFRVRKDNSFPPAISDSGESKVLWLRPRASSPLVADRDRAGASSASAPSHEAERRGRSCGTIARACSSITHGHRSSSEMSSTMPMMRMAEHDGHGHQRRHQIGDHVCVAMPRLRAKSRSKADVHHRTQPQQRRRRRSSAVSTASAATSAVGHGHDAAEEVCRTDRPTCSPDAGS